MPWGHKNVVLHSLRTIDMVPITMLSEVFSRKELSKRIENNTCSWVLLLNSRETASICEKKNKKAKQSMGTCGFSASPTSSKAKNRKAHYSSPLSGIFFFSSLLSRNGAFLMKLNAPHPSHHIPQHHPTPSKCSPTPIPLPSLLSRVSH